MKNKLIIPGLLLIAGLSVISCKNSETAPSEMQAPVANNDELSVPTVNLPDATAKNISNLQAAFAGESNATARYAAFAKKAAEEGHKEIAILFKAASLAEKIHAENHKAVLAELGVAASPVTLDIKVKSTKENLEFAIKGETYEATEMYPNFLKDADAAKSQLAMISLNYAYKTEKKHQVLYQKALAALNGNSGNKLPSVYFVCPTCGNTYETTASKRCGISMTDGERFVKINSI